MVKKFLIEFALKYKINKMPHWLIFLLILIAILAIYQIYNDILYFTGAYQGCSDCSQ